MCSCVDFVCYAKWRLRFRFRQLSEYFASKCDEEVIEQLTTNESNVEDDVEDDSKSDAWLPDSDYEDASVGHGSVDTDASGHEPVAVELGEMQNRQRMNSSSS